MKNTKQTLNIHLQLSLSKPLLYNESTARVCLMLGDFFPSKLEAQGCHTLKDNGLNMINGL